MPHTSRKKKPARQKRTLTVDENGWTRVSSHQPSMGSCYSRPEGHNGPADDGRPLWVEDHESRLNPLPIADGMTEEKLMDRYKVLEKKWLESDSCKQLSKVIREAVERIQVKIKICVCFGTGTMSGVKDEWIMRHDVALTQIAVFKSGVDMIEHVQSSRPTAYAQEPRYNTLDTTFLSKLQIMRVDSPNGFELLNPRGDWKADRALRFFGDHPASFCYCPGAELDVSIGVLKREPNLYLGGNLHWLRDRLAESAGPFPHSYDESIKGDQQKTLQMIDEFLDGHDLQMLPELDAADYPFHEQRLYSRKRAGERELVTEG